MNKGARMIDGREYLLNGRFYERGEAFRVIKERRKQGRRVRLIKYSKYDYTIFEHG